MENKESIKQWNREMARAAAKEAYKSFAGLPSEFDEWFDSEYPEPSTVEPAAETEEVQKLRGLLLEIGVRSGILLPTEEWLIDLFDAGFVSCWGLFAHANEMLYDNAKEIQEQTRPHIPPEYQNDDDGFVEKHLKNIKLLRAEYANKFPVPPSPPSIQQEAAEDRMIRAIREHTDKLIAEGPDACRRYLQEAGFLDNTTAQQEAENKGRGLKAFDDSMRSTLGNLLDSSPFDDGQQEAIPEEEKTLGRILKEARVAKRMSVENLLEATGVSNEYLRKLEADELKSPSASVLWKLAQYYEIDLKPLAVKAGIIIKAPSPPSSGHIHVQLSGGAIANVSPDVSPELLDALNTMTKMAMQTVDPPSVKTEREESEEWHPQDYSGKNAPSPIVQESEPFKCNRYDDGFIDERCDEQCEYCAYPHEPATISSLQLQISAHEETLKERLDKIALLEKAHESLQSQLSDLKKERDDYRASIELSLRNYYDGYERLAIGGLKDILAKYPIPQTPNNETGKG